MTVARSVAGILIGYLIFAVSAVALFQITGQRPHAQASWPFMLATALYGMMFAALGGWAAARLVPRQPHLQGILVAALIAIGAIVSLLFSGADARWSQWQALLLMAPMACVGSRRK